MRFGRLIPVLYMLVLAACNNLPFAIGTQATGTSPMPAPVTPQATPSPTATETPSGPITLRVWLPPQFDPASGTPAGRLLQERLNEFVKRRPGVRLEVRVKAVEGPAGMLESLSVTSAAAPTALPDLVALPRYILEAAALKGLLRPYDGLTTVLDDTDWYNYARELAQLQKSTFGIPFAGDALILLYRPSSIEQPPRSWDEMLNAPDPLIFPAADPQALCTLTFYLAAGGPIQDDQGRPWLDSATLAQVLTFYQQAHAANLWFSALPEIETDAQVWSVFLEGQSEQAITWFSRYMEQLKALPATSTPSPEGTPAVNSVSGGDYAGAPLPTPRGERYTLATGWVWALANHHAERQALSVQLAEFLTQSEFMSQWTLAAGYLPPRASALSRWTNAPAQSLARQIIPSARLIPNIDIVSSLAQPLKKAVLGILEDKGDPLSLAQEAVERLENP